jgi:hypothetical protein
MRSEGHYTELELMLNELLSKIIDAADPDDAEDVAIRRCLVATLYEIANLPVGDGEDGFWANPRVRVAVPMSYVRLADRRPLAA